MAEKPKSPLSQLAAAGNQLLVSPETFDVRMGKTKGYVISHNLEESREPASRRVMSYNGQVATVPGKITYKSTIEVVWQIDSLPESAADLKTQLADLEHRLAIRQQYGDEADMDYFFDERG